MPGGRDGGAESTICGRAAANRTMLAKGSGREHHPRGQFHREGDSWTTAGPIVRWPRRHRVRGADADRRRSSREAPPKPNDSTAKIVKFVTDKNDQLRWAGFVGVLASIVLLGWLGAVWRLLRRAEGGVVRLAVGAALGAAMAAALQRRRRAGEQSRIVGVAEHRARALPGSSTCCSAPSVPPAASGWRCSWARRPP